ncbi:MAG: HypC/HybG/HupF family hydrogenase formation chaperone [Nevskiaceae bacterium]|jgi:hydrogenase expression/formation protein HypC|nr:HypC/HybG/HupF family hydrogenase formation chaperone [Nevskiaceae bacterium]
MCVGIPMQVIAISEGHALCEGRGQHQRIGTTLIGAVTPGEWLLVFLNDARERITATRAAEINAALDLALNAMHAAPPLAADVGFALPSQMTAAQMRALTCP